MNISKVNQKKIFNILLKIEEYESSITSRKNFRKNKTRRNIISVNLTIFCTAIVLLLISAFNHNYYVVLVGLILLLICEILMLVEVIVDIIYSRKDFIDFFKQPTRLLLRNVRVTTNSTIKYLAELLNFSSSDLNLAKKEIEYEKDHFDKRTSIISGSIEKIGIFPSILATAVLLIAQLANNKFQEFLDTHPQVQFVFYALIGIVIIFQFFSIMTNFTSLKISHMIQVLDQAIELKKDQEKSDSAEN